MQATYEHCTNVCKRVGVRMSNGGCRRTANANVSAMRSLHRTHVTNRPQVLCAAFVFTLSVIPARSSPLAFSLMLALLTLAMLPADHHQADADPATPREYYALVAYENDDVARGERVGELLSESIAPIVREFAGVRAVGLFAETDEQPKNASKTGTVYLLAACDNIRTATTLTDQLAGNEAPQQAFRSVDWPIMKNARVTYLIAFTSIPELELPPETAAGDDRVFEMRTYYSADADKARLKMEMFDEGETQLMRDVKLQPVFYGSALVAADEEPHLVYLLSAPSLEAHKQNWQGFLDSPGWAGMKNTPRYRGTVSKIEQVFLQPLPGSDI